MSRTLQFIDRLLAIGRNYQQVHRHREALRCLSRVAAMPDLPAELAEETQVRLAEIQIERHRYRRARRHLTIALLYRADSARYHHLLASVLAKGSSAEPERALTHYRKSLEIEPEQPRCLAEFGRLCVQTDRVEEGLAALCRAVELAPNDPEIVDMLWKGLWQTGRRREAREVLRAARFRNPRDGRFLKLWNDFRFRRLRRWQKAKRLAAAINWTNDERAVVLPFIRPDLSIPTPADGTTIRCDEPTVLPAPHVPKPARRSDWKHG